MRVRFALRALAAPIAVAALAAGCASAPAPGASGRLVALGDSFTANSTLLPNTRTNGCYQSTGNQPRLVGERLNMNVADASCDGATTGDILGGDNPQIAKVTSGTDVVLLSIGGNDIGFSDIAVKCSERAITFRTCKGDYVTAAGDTLSAKIAATRTKVDTVLARVKNRAPGARIAVYGYPTLFPMSGTSTCFGMTMSSKDIPYLRSKQAELNTMLRNAASAADATYVDVYTPSAGHDPCSSSPWVNKVIDVPPLHPTHRGQTAVGNRVADALD